MYVLAYGGLRIGEASALRVGRFDSFQGSVRIIETASEVGGRLIIGPPKTKASIRTVKLPRFVAAELRSHIREYTDGSDEAFIFPGAQGGALRARAFRQRYWLKAVKSAGLTPLRIHDLRHTAISLWIAAQPEPKLVAARAGHSSVVTVYDRYGHLFPDREDDLVDDLDRMRVPNARGVRGVPNAI